MKIQVLIPFFIYLILLIFFGIYTSRNVSRGMSGLFLGDRKMNRFVIAISAAVSARGVWLLMGVTTYAYIMGLSSVWLAVGFVLSEILLFLFVAPVIRQYSESHGCLTLIDVFITRFRDESKTLRIIISVAVLFFSLIFISAQFMAGGRAFYAFFGITLSNGIIITGIIALLFVFLGGFKTISYSDIVNSILILIVLISLSLLILFRKEGIENLQAEILLLSPNFFDIKALSAGAFVGFLSIGLGSPGNPNLLVKFISINDPKHYRYMTIVNAVTNILMVSGAICIGIFAKAYFPGPESIPGADAQNVFIGITGLLFPPLLLGIVLISIIASVMSAAGSQILISASTLVSDIYVNTMNRGKISSQARLTFYSRIVFAILVYIAILLGIYLDTDIYRFFLFACAGLGATIGPAIILTLFWKGVTSAGIKAGVITGGLTVIIWKSSPFLSEQLFEFAPGFILATFAIYIVSYIEKKLISLNLKEKQVMKTLIKPAPGNN